MQNYIKDTVYPPRLSTAKNGLVKEDWQVRTEALYHFWVKVTTGGFKFDVIDDGTDKKSPKAKTPKTTKIEKESMNYKIPEKYEDEIPKDGIINKTDPVFKKFPKGLLVQVGND